jgi:hypothetical protein
MVARRPKVIFLPDGNTTPGNYGLYHGFTIGRPDAKASYILDTNCNELRCFSNINMSVERNMKEA